VHRENLFVNDGCNWQAVKTVGKSLPQLDVVPAFTWEDKNGKPHEEKKLHKQQISKNAHSS